MVRWIRTRQLIIITAVVGALLIGGAGAVLAAQNYASPGAAHTQASSSDATGTTNPQATPEATSQHDPDRDQDDDSRSGSDGQTLSGVIQSVSMESHRFVLLPDGQQGTVTIAFGTKTEIDQEDGASPLVAGTHVVAEVVKQEDGTLSAIEIRGSQPGGDGQGNG